MICGTTPATIPQGENISSIDLKVAFDLRQLSPKLSPKEKARIRKRLRALYYLERAKGIEPYKTGF